MAQHNYIIQVTKIRRILNPEQKSEYYTCVLQTPEIHLTFWRKADDDILKLNEICFSFRLKVTFIFYNCLKYFFGLWLKPEVDILQLSKTKSTYIISPQNCTPLLHILQLSKKRIIFTKCILRFFYNSRIREKEHLIVLFC